MIWAYIIGALIVLYGFTVFFGAPYVPSRRRDVKRMFDELYPLGKGDLLVDMGSGDGMILREASRRGAKAVGYEISPILVFISKWLSKGDKKVTISISNHWQALFPKATTVVYAFSVERDAKRLKKKVQTEADRLKKSLVLICYGSPIPKLAAEQTFEAYHLYRFYPLQVSKA